MRLSPLSASSSWGRWQPSVAVDPTRRIVQRGPIPGLSLIVSPIVTGLVMERWGEWRESRGNQRSLRRSGAARSSRLRWHWFDSCCWRNKGASPGLFMNLRIDAPRSNHKRTKRTGDVWLRNPRKLLTSSSPVVSSVVAAPDAPAAAGHVQRTRCMRGSTVNAAPEKCGTPERRRAEAPRASSTRCRYGGPEPHDAKSYP